MKFLNFMIYGVGSVIITTVLLFYLRFLGENVSLGLYMVIGFLSWILMILSMELNEKE